MTKGEGLPEWTGRTGDGWMSIQPVMDAVFTPLEELLTEAVRATGGRRVLDVGCGPGATTLSIARMLGDGGSCTGVDVSEVLLAFARERAAAEGVAATFELGDAQRYPFEPASVDVVASRFGIMFFDDPVAAFTNLHAATAPGGALRALVWRTPAENPFMTAATVAAVEAGLVEVPALPPEAPGPFALGDAARTTSLLREAGWQDPVLEPVDVPCLMPVTELVRYATTLGALGRALAGADEAEKARIGEVVRPAYDPFVEGDVAHYDAAIWLVQATA